MCVGGVWGSRGPRLKEAEKDMVKGYNTAAFDLKGPVCGVGNPAALQDIGVE